METLYDLLGALPDDDADSLRAAFRRAVKRAHPDVNPGDPDAGLKFRRIVRANEILGDGEQRAAYDHLLEVAHLEQEEAAKLAEHEGAATLAVANKVHKLASGVMALAGVSVVAVGAYALFAQLSANTLAPGTAATGAVRGPAAVVAAGPPGEAAANASTAPAETSGHGDVTNSAIVAAAVSTPSYPAETTPGRVGPSLDRTAKHSPKFASARIDRSSILYPLRKFARAFASLSQAKRLQKPSRDIVSSPPQAANANTNEIKKSSGGGDRAGALGTTSRRGATSRS